MVILETVISFGDCCAVRSGLIAVCSQPDVPNGVLISHTGGCCCCNCTLVLCCSQLWLPPTRTLYGRCAKRVWVRDAQLKVPLAACWMDPLWTGPVKIVSLFPFFFSPVGILLPFPAPLMYLHTDRATLVCTARCSRLQWIFKVLLTKLTRRTVKRF